jgi:hypothetical protein
MSMSRILRVLDEIKWDKYLYHATDASFDPKSMKPGSHFGKLHAAIARNSVSLSNKVIPLRTRDAPRTDRIHAYEYHPSGKSLEIPEHDEDSRFHNDASMLSHQLHKQGVLSDVEHRRISTSGKMDDFAKTVRSKGYSSLHYKNKSEDPGSTSHIILDPENLHHVKTFHTPDIMTRNVAAKWDISSAEGDPTYKRVASILAGRKKQA